MLTVHGYSDLATDKRAAGVLKDIEGLLNLPAEDPRAKALVNLLIEMVHSQVSETEEIGCPIDLVLLLSRGLELNCLNGEHDLDELLSIGFMIADQLALPGIGTAFIILHARHNLAYKDPRGAFTLAHQAVELARQEQSSLHEASALLLAARGQMSLGQNMAAEIYLDGAMVKARKAGNQQLLFEVVLQQGSLALFNGNLANARKYAADALERVQKLGDDSALIRVKALQMMCENGSSTEPTDLEGLLKGTENLVPFDPVTYLSQLDSVAEAYIAMGNYERSEQLTNRIIKLAPAIQQYYPLTRSLHRKGRLALERGQYYSALGSVSAALRLADEHQIPEIAVRSRIVCGQASINLAKELSTKKSRREQCRLDQLVIKGFAKLEEAISLAIEYGLTRLQVLAELRLIDCLMIATDMPGTFDDSLFSSLEHCFESSHPGWQVDIPKSKGKINVWCSQMLKLIWDQYDATIQQSASHLWDELTAKAQSTKDVV